MNKVIRAEAGEGYTIQVWFADGVSGTVDLSAKLFGPMFEPLQNLELFARVGIDEYGAVFWPNGADLAPDGIYHVLAAKAEQESRVLVL